MVSTALALRVASSSKGLLPDSDVRDAGSTVNVPMQTPTRCSDREKIGPRGDQLQALGREG
jgi:hypothetical protein